MITRGIVTNVIDDYTYTLDIPSLTDYGYESHVNATVCSIINNKMILPIGTAVIVDFENRQSYKPVILGVLYNEKSSSINSTLSFNSINTAGVVNLPENSTIGKITRNDLANIGGLTKNIQIQINDITDNRDSLDISKDNIENDIDSTHDSIEGSITSVVSIDEKIKSIDKIIGKASDKKGTVYGRLNIISEKLNKADKFLKTIPKDKTAEQMINDVMNKIVEKKGSSTSLIPLNLNFGDIKSSDWAISLSSEDLEESDYTAAKSKQHITLNGQRQNIKCFYAVAKKFGWSDVSICGVIGCLINESGMNPGCQFLQEKYGKEGFNYYPNGYGIGLCQWTKERHTQMVEYVTSHYGNWYDANGQMAFLLEEVTNGSKKTASATISQLDFIPEDLRFKNTLDMLRCSNSRWTLEMATSWWLACYEAGFGSSASQNYYNSLWDTWYPRRLESAKEAYTYLSNL